MKQEDAWGGWSESEQRGVWQRLRTGGAGEMEKQIDVLEKKGGGVSSALWPRRHRGQCFEASAAAQVVEEPFRRQVVRHSRFNATPPPPLLLFGTLDPKLVSESASAAMACSSAGRGAALMRNAEVIVA